MTLTPTPEDVSAAAAVLRRGGDPRRSFCLAAARLLGADAAALWEVDGDGLRLSASVGDLDVGPSARLPLGPGSVAGQVAAGGLRWFVGDVLTHPGEDGGPAAELGLRSVLGEPVQIGRAQAGALVLGWRRAIGGLDPLVSGFLSLMAVQASMAIERGDLASTLERQALTDPLTELPNRRGLAQQLDREMARAARRGSPLGFVLMDLDNFKAYNDTRGHAAGDRLLVRAARAWGAQVRVQDVLARYGGEEFVLLLPDCGVGPLTPLEVVDRVRGATPDRQTVSAGLAIWDGRELPHQLLHRADTALYAAKQDGRDRALAA